VGELVRPTVMTASDAGISKTHWNSIRVWSVLAVAVFFVVAVHGHHFSVNSPYFHILYWQWIASKRVYPVLIALAIPFFIGQILYLRRPARIWAALGAVTLSTFGLMIGGAVLQNDPPSFYRISTEVQSRWSTGYFDSAAMLVRKGMPVRQLLARYPGELRHFYLHPRDKPPGPILIEMAIIRVFGAGTTGAMVSGWLTGVAASLSVIATYLFISCFTGSRDAAFFGASYFALCPSLLLFFPDFDPCYPILTAAVTVLWALALKGNQARYAIAFGVAYAVAGLITYLPGVLPIFLVGFTFLQFRGEPGCSWTRILKHLTISLGMFAAFYLALWAATGFNPIATLVECHKQLNIIWHIFINVLHYPGHSLPATFFTDLYDFAMGSGWISFILVGFYFRSAIKEGLTPQARIALVSVLQFFIIAVVGLLQTETSRIWIFMYPMLMLPIGLELAGWRARARIAVYAALFLLTAAMCQSMEFMSSIP
jgi:hypothetical protein